jgi:NAD(P)-dependent dehydrogenase (short-subunit alcohol dehydrogenase family)
VVAAEGDIRALRRAVDRGRRADRVGSAAVDAITLDRLFDLEGRVALVTGASSGFGDRFARVLSAAGAKVVAVARRAERLEKLASEVDGVVPFAADVAADDACRRAVDTAVERFGRLDVLINNAGVSDAPARAEEEDPSTFRAVIEVNLNACFVLASLAARPMLEAGRGSIINIASVHGQVGSSPNNQLAYVTSKHGLVGMTRDLGLQWATRGVRVNAISPGYFETELTAEMFTSEESGLGWITRNTRMRRAGQVSELDGALLYLASDASSYMTGQTLVLDGGWTAR